MQVLYFPFERHWLAIIGPQGWIIGPCRWEWSATLFGLLFILFNKKKAFAPSGEQ